MMRRFLGRESSRPPSPPDGDVHLDWERRTDGRRDGGRMAEGATTPLK